MKKTTIVAADDDPHLLRLVTRNLQLEGYEVLAASDGQQALTLIEEQSPALALLDVMMPKLDGFSITQRVRSFSSIPIIILTARGQDQDKIRGLDLGADDYLTKPFSIEELLARVRAVLRRSQFTAQEAGHGVPGTQRIGDLTIDYSQHRGCKINCVRGQLNRKMKMEDEGERYDPSQTQKSVSQRYHDFHRLD